VSAPKPLSQERIEIDRQAAQGTSPPQQRKSVSAAFMTDAISDSGKSNRASVHKSKEVESKTTIISRSTKGKKLAKRNSAQKPMIVRTDVPALNTFSSFVEESFGLHLPTQPEDISGDDQAIILLLFH